MNNCCKRLLIPVLSAFLLFPGIYIIIWLLFDSQFQVTMWVSLRVQNANGTKGINFIELCTYDTQYKAECQLCTLQDCNNWVHFELQIQNLRWKFSHFYFYFYFSSIFAVQCCPKPCWTWSSSIKCKYPFQ